MSARRVGQRVFDWVRIASRVPEEARMDFSAFRARHEACRASLSALSERPEPIDWAYYRRNISLPNLVDSFEQQFEAVSIPYPKDTVSAGLDMKQKEVEVEAQAVIAQSKARIVELQKELDEVNAQKPFEDMTIDEYLEDKPEIKKQADSDMRNHIWYLGKE